VYIVEGSITDLRLNETHPGMYACRPPGMPRTVAYDGVSTFQLLPA